MNNRKSIYFLLPLIALVLMACRVGFNIGGRQIEGSGNVATETREISNVERVSLEFMGDLTIIQGDEESLTVEADDNLLQYIETDMRGRELVIYMEDEVNVDTKTPIHYTLRVKNLDRVSVSGSGNVSAETFAADKLDLQISGSGNMRFDDLKANDLEVRISGSGNFDLVGSSEVQDVRITGSGNYRAENFQTTRSTVTVSGSGDVTVWADEALDVNITGVGNINYYGNPKVSQNISGSGSIKSLGEQE